MTAAETGTDSRLTSPAPQPLARIPAPPVGDFAEAHVTPARPVVLRGLTGVDASFSRCTIDHLREAFPDVPVTTARVRNGAVVMDDDRGLVHEKSTFSTFLAALDAGDREHYLTTRLAELPLALRLDLAPPPYCADAPWQDANLWIGAPGIVSGLHRDLADNLHVQISGRKRFLLVSPRQSACVYPNSLFDGVPNGSRVDLEQPDLERFPRMGRLAITVAELEPGDAVYIPRGWWHQVRTLELSVSVNFWWASGLRHAVVVAAEVFKRARGVSL